MKAEDIVKFLWARLPLFTDLFSTVLAIQNLTYNSGTGLVEIETVTPHGLINGSSISIKDITNPINITSLVFNEANKSVLVETSTSHDLVYNSFSIRALSNKTFTQTIFSDDTLITIENVSIPEYNGAFVLISTPSSTTFEYLIIGTNTPASNGNNGNLKGLYNPFQSTFVVDIVDTANLSFTVVTPFPVNDPIGFSDILIKHKITRALNVERAMASYTVQQGLVLFVSLEDSTGASSFVSQERNLETDGVGKFAVGQFFRQNIMNRFSVNVFFPTTKDDVGAGVTRDLAIDIRQFVLNSLLGIVPPTPGKGRDWGGLTFVRDSVVAYNTAFFVYSLDFEFISTLVGDDMAFPFDEIKLETLNIEYRTPEENDDIIMTDKIDF